MKLLMCAECSSVFNLERELRRCNCGKSSGHYKSDGHHAEHDGPSVLLGFANISFVAALRNAREDKRLGKKKLLGRKFHAFVVPWNSPTVRKVEGE